MTRAARASTERAPMEARDQDRATAEERARTLNLARRIGYAVLPGDLFSYILHLRPAEWPIMVAHTAVGIFLALGIGAGAQPIPWGDVAFGLLLWVVCLNGGTLAINSAYDDDPGDIGYLEAPPRPPAALAPFSIALMAVGQIGALRLGAPFAIAYAICFLMAILYSVPPFRWKAIAGADWFINMWGFGALTAYAGWAITGRPLELWAALVFLAFCPLFAAFYPLTQIYQIEEDLARGDRTLTIALGVDRALAIAIAATTLAFGIFGAAIAIGPAGRWWPAILVPLAAWLAVLIPWLRRHETMDAREHQRGMYAALRAWAVTDIVVLAIFALR